MKVRKHINKMLLGILAILMLLPVHALAAGSIDLEHDTALNIFYQEEDKALKGAAFDIYLVATADESGQLKLTDTFSKYNINIQIDKEADWRKLASTLEGYVLRDKITPTDSQTTDTNGVAAFPSDGKKLACGLYLIVGASHTQDGYVYNPSSFMVMLPSQNKETNTWMYEVTVNAKFESIEPGLVSKKALKVWDDEGREDERPEEVIVDLICDGEIYDTVSLNEDNNWQYTWENLDNTHKWTLAERELEKYAALVTEEGITFVVTNYYLPEGYSSTATTETTTTTTTERTTATTGSNGDGDSGGSGNSGGSGDKLPQTGQLWWPVPVLIAFGLLFMIAGLLRRRGRNHEE